MSIDYRNHMSIMAYIRTELQKLQVRVNDCKRKFINLSKVKRCGASDRLMYAKAFYDYEWYKRELNVLINRYHKIKTLYFKTLHESKEANKIGE